MLECAPGIFEAELHSNQRSTDEIKVFLTPGKDEERSPIMDVGFRSRTYLHVTEEVLGKLGTTYDRLGMFLAHKHHNHCGLASKCAVRGAGLFMNPQEDRHCYDCLCYNHSHDSSEDQPQVLRSVEVTEEGTSEIWNVLMGVNQRIRESRGWEFEIPGYPYIPVNEGQILNYGDYSLETVGLKGHTHGQMGLHGRSHKVLFCADQVIDGTVSIMGTIYPDEHLLKGYPDSLERLKHQYGDCLILPAHREPTRGVKWVVDRTVFAYLDKTDLIEYVLDHGHYRVTTREVARLAYGIDHMPRDQSESTKFEMAISRTFSCLEYLHGEDFAICALEGGNYCWEALQGETP